jgi:hypothetical protein
MKVVDFSGNLIGFDNTLEKFRFLWKLNDPDWLKERKIQARTFAAKLSAGGDSAKTIREYTHYFCRGEYQDYIDATNKFFMTPIDSPDIARQVFESQLFSEHERRSLYGVYATKTHAYCPGMPWLGYHVRYFIDGVLGEQFEEIEEEVNGRRYRTSPVPSSWCAKYIRSVVDLFEQQDGYYGCLDCLPYFVSALPYMTHANSRRKSKLDEMLGLAETVSQQSDAMPEARGLAVNMMERKAEIEEAWAVNAHIDKAGDD